MDGVALASVITSDVVAIRVVIWTTRQSAKLAREIRMQQRLGESCPEVLRIVEREGPCIEANVTNWKLAAEELATCGIDAVRNEKETGFKRVKVPEPLAVTDRATIAAHLAWRSITTAIDTEIETVRFNAYVSYYTDIRPHPGSPPF